MEAVAVAVAVAALAQVATTPKVFEWDAAPEEEEGREHILAPGPLPLLAPVPRPVRQPKQKTVVPDLLPEDPGVVWVHRWAPQ